MFPTEEHEYWLSGAYKPGQGGRTYGTLIFLAPVRVWGVQHPRHSECLMLTKISIFSSEDGWSLTEPWSIDALDSHASIKDHRPIPHTFPMDHAFQPEFVQCSLEAARECAYSALFSLMSDTWEMLERLKSLSVAGRKPEPDKFGRFTLVASVFTRIQAERTAGDARLAFWNKIRGTK